jgi:hypothetical protein
VETFLLAKVCEFVKNTVGVLGPKDLEVVRKKCAGIRENTVGVLGPLEAETDSLTTPLNQTTDLTRKSGKR